MSRTLEPGLTLLTAAEIRVVVLPIGPMPRDTLDGYLGALNAHRHVPLHATRCFYQGGPKSPFPHQAYKAGALHLRFLQADEARRRTRIAQLHQQRQVVAALGLLHCPLVEDLLAAHAEFERSSKQWPEALVARCCAFEPSAAHLATPGCQKLKDLMVMPVAHLNAHLEVYMTEFAADILAAIEDMVLTSSVTTVKLNTYVDSGDFLGPLAQIEEGLKKLNVNEEEVKEKKRWGRFQKFKGDWALMAGSPRDAFEHYKSAMELSRVSGDAIWYGAAVEGLAHARVLEALIAARPTVTGTPRPSIKAVAAAQQAAAAADSIQSAVSDTAAVTSQSGPAAAAAAAADTEATEPGKATAAVDAAPLGSPKLFTLASADSAALLEAVDAATQDTKTKAAAAAITPSDDQVSLASAAEALLAVQAVSTGHSATPELLLDTYGSQSDLEKDPVSNIPATAEAVSAAQAGAAAPNALSSCDEGTSCVAVPSAVTTPAAAGTGSTGRAHYLLSGPAAWAVLAGADLEGEVRELLGEARAWYKKKGGALVLQIEQQLKLSRFIAGLHGPVAAQRDAAETVGLIIESLPVLPLLEDKLVSLVEAGQLLGLVGCGRKRLLLLWAALEMYKQTAGDKGPAEADGMLRLTLKTLQPPEIPRQLDPDDVPHVHWAMKRFLAWQQQHMQHMEDQQQHTSSAAKLGGSSRNSSARQAAQQSSSLSKQQQFMQLLGQHLQLLSSQQVALLQQFTSSDSTELQQPGFSAAKLWGLRNRASTALGFGCQWISPWGSVLVAVLESVVNIAKAANSPVETWEAAATLLRELYPLLPQALQVNLIEACAAAGAAMGSRARQRPGPGPGPQVQMKRVLPGAPCLQPLHLSAADVGAPGSRASTAAAQSGPFIFNPYAAKRQGASAAAAAEAALPEWVCGEEGWVEVLLVNPCATPLKLDQLQLVVQPLPGKADQQQQQQQDDIDTSSSSTSQHSAKNGVQSSGLQGQQDFSVPDSGSRTLNPVRAPRSVSVSLPAGSKPVRVQLSYSPPKAGFIAITGIQASCWGVSWYQPFVQLPKLTAPAAAAAGPEALNPQGVFTVSVQPPLPLIKAMLHGPEVQLVAPSEDELAGFTSISTSSSSSWSTATVGGTAGSTAAGAAAAAAGVSELDKKVTNVFVFEGQSLDWTLSLSNISSQTVTGCRVSVLNAKGLQLKALYPGPATATLEGQQQQPLPPRVSGAHMEVGEQGLAASLPLKPGCSMLLPVAVTIGQPTGDAFDSIMLQVCITYHGTSRTGQDHIIGRRLTLPLRLTIQPTLQLKSIRFLQQTLPLLNGRRYIKPRLLHIGHARLPLDSRAGAGVADGTPKQQQGSGGASPQLVEGLIALGSPSSSLLKRQKSHHVRNSSDGAVQTLGSLGAAGVSALLLSRSPTRSPAHKRVDFEGGLDSGSNTSLAAAAAAAAAAASVGDGTGEVGSSSSRGSLQPQQPQQQTDSISGCLPSKAGAVTGAAAAMAGSAGSLAVGSEPVLELSVRNASDRYFRAWLGCLPDHITAESSLTVVAVLEPGDTQRLVAVLPATVAPGVAAFTAPSLHSPANRFTPGNTAAAAVAAPAAAAAARHKDNCSGCSSSVAGSGLSEPSRLACAERIVERLVVCWEMITGAAASGHMPLGKVHLAPLDVAANLTPGAIAAVSPSPLLLRFSVPPCATNGAPELVDLLLQCPASLANVVLSGLPGLSGPLWGLKSSVDLLSRPLLEDLLSPAMSPVGAGTVALQVGQWWSVELVITYTPRSSSSSTAAAAAATGAAHTLDSGSSTAEERNSLQLLVSVAVNDLLSSSSSSSAGQHPGTPTFATAPAAAAAAALGSGSVQHGCVGTTHLVDPGVCIVGCYTGCQVNVQPGGKEVVRFQVLLAQPGLYQFSIADVVCSGAGIDGMKQPTPAAAAAAAVGAGGGGSCGGAVSSVTASGSKCASRVYFNQDRLYVLVQ